jgi:surface protein
MSNMFNGCSVFNADITQWNTGSVINMSGMFEEANQFNRDIGFWDTADVIDMTNMFAGSSPAFNQNLRYWSIRNSTTLANMFTNPSTFATEYYNISGGAYPTANFWGPGTGATPNPVTTPLYTFFNLDPLTRFPCFMKGTQILCFRGEEEVYRPIQDLRKGDLVKTYRNGYLPIHMIGTSTLSNPGDEERITNRLYKCSKELYPDLFEDLYITGCHSILVPSLTDDQWENTKAILGNVYITDNHFRLMACVDEKAQPYKRDAMIDIYHIALENDDYYMNYGVYANGLLVESCSKRYLTELSNMRIIGEDEACYDTPKVNVFSELGAFVQTF